LTREAAGSVRHSDEDLRSPVAAHVADHNLGGRFFYAPSRRRAARRPGRSASEAVHAEIISEQGAGLRREHVAYSVTIEVPAECLNVSM
jgi:hypothetical protein